jgi:dynactin-4
VSLCFFSLFFLSFSFHSSPFLPAQLQKFEDAAPESLEFERLKEHFEPFLRASSSSAGLSGHSHAAHSHHTPVNPITAAASSALARDIPGVGKYTPAAPPRGRRDKGARDEISEYRTRVGVGGTKDAANVDFMRRLEEVSQVAALSQRWTNSWMTTLRSRYSSLFFCAV